MLICPVCKAPLSRLGNVYQCKKHHTYDIAAQGYVNLLQANKKSSPQPGDNADMIAARAQFLSGGWYERLSDLLNQQIESCCASLSRPALLDAGCGEGYYIQRLEQLLPNPLGSAKPEYYGIDLSRYGARRAARRCPNANIAIASIFDLPFADGSLDIIYSVFAPQCHAEFLRALRHGGFFISVYPGARHLYQMKEILYDEPYENDEPAFSIDGFSPIDKHQLSYTISLADAQTIHHLFLMTPYFYKTPAAGTQRLTRLHSLCTEVDFIVAAYQKR